MLCGLCFRMLRSQEGRIWKGTYDLYFEHHRDGGSLHRSAKDNCSICRVLFEHVKELQSKSTPAVPLDGFRLSTTASLSEVDNPHIGELYRLDFRLEYDLDQVRTRSQRTFVLKRANPGDPPFRTPISDDTSSDEVYQLARRWMLTCNCIDESKPPSFYPARLISLEKFKKRNYFDKETLESVHEPKNVGIKLVETASWKGVCPTRDDFQYVTLSHCWGSQEHAERQIKLHSGNIDTFIKDGLLSEDLPKTFQDAIQFAAKIPRVGYIWIDSLCIKQGPEEREDWLQQSAEMDKVYSNTMLNISATAAKNSEGGLFFPREKGLLLEAEVILNIDGIPRAKAQEPAANRRKFSRGELNTIADDTHLRRCMILDASFWTIRVDNAPVNRRGWVLQERFMAPRVLHFCYDQVAWECAEFDASEGQPQGMPNLQLTSDGIVEESRLKGLDPMKDGKRLREIRLQGYEDPDPHLNPNEVYALELWRRIIEVYSKTAITDPGDKLIALSGIARWMAGRISTLDAPAEYVAGMWKTHLASQLLWKVDPVFNPHTNIFSIPTTESKVYRAPSFSWASIDTDKGHGITSAEVTDKDLLIRVEEVKTALKSDSNPYGVIESGYLMIWGMLREAVLYKKPKGRYGWKLVDREDLSEEEHTNVYLDCPERDESRFLLPTGSVNHDAGIYIVPAAKGERTVSEESKYLTCLILQLDKQHPTGKAFRRIGLAKLSPWGDKIAMQDYKILEVYKSDRKMPHHEGAYLATVEQFCSHCNRFLSVKATYTQLLAMVAWKFRKTEGRSTILVSDDRQTISGRIWMELEYEPGT